MYVPAGHQRRLRTTQGVFRKGGSERSSLGGQRRCSGIISVRAAIQELETGILLIERKDARKGSILRTWMDQHVLPAFAEQIIPVETAVALRSAGLHIPEPRPVRDALIAAMAIVHGIPVVTRNASDFEPTGVTVIDPWER